MVNLAIIRPHFFLYFNHFLRLSTIKLFAEMPSVQLSEFVAYRGLTKRLLSIIGLWPHAQPSFFYRSLPILQLLLFICASLTILGYVIKNFTDVALVTKGMSLMIGYLTCALKVK